MKAEYLKLYEQNPALSRIRRAVEVMQNGGVIIYPTDTIYAFGCDIYNTKAIEKICNLRGLNVDKNQLSFICKDISHVSEYVKPISSQVFKLMKRVLPGPYTFILNANNKVPKILHSKKKQVGIRVPDNNIALSLVEEMGNPIISSSIHDDDDVIEYTTNPELIYEKYGNQVDLMIDGGNGNNTPSTVLDCTKEEVDVIREGLGEIEPYLE